MRQMYGDRVSVPVLPQKPPSDSSGVYGAVMSGFSAAMKVVKYALKLSMTGGTSTQLYMYGLDSEDLSWGLISDVGNLGEVGGIAIPSGNEYYFIVRDIGWLAELTLVEKGAVGATASLSIGTVSTDWNTVVQSELGAGGGGNQIQVQLIGNASAKAGSLSEVGNLATFSFLPGSSQVSDMETLITGSSNLLSIKTGGTGATTLLAGDAFGPTNLAGGTPVTTATLIEIIENNYRRAD